MFRIFSLWFRWVPAWASGRGSRGYTPLHWAAESGHVSAVERLLEAKAAVDAQNNRGRGLGTRNLRGVGTSTFSKTSTFEVPKFSQNFSPLPFRWVLLAGFGPSGRGSRGFTPLHLAAKEGHVSAVERLIEAKAAMDALANTGRGLGTKGLGGNTS